MGVPALFRWLSKKYPKIIQPVLEDNALLIESENGPVEVPIDMAGPNPNGQEFDALYLDMNGIVHPCTHPEGKPAPETEEEMMLEIFSYTERVVNMVRPRKLLFMAIDGVAPRAKMNQQRSRRFRASAEAKIKEEARQENLVLWESMGKTVGDEEKNKKAWDSNAITPGTPFMDLLAASLRYWVVQKMNTDQGWKNMQVIISDASVPGEGEHKIMAYIRRQRSNPGYDPNTKHVIYGLDADLIMLALATHEPYFKVLREDVFSDSNSSGCRKCGTEGHFAAHCSATEEEIAAFAQKMTGQKKPFIFLDVSILREYLSHELFVPNFPGYDAEKALDDWVLLIFFVGNDFLPHLPSLEIREGAIDTLLRFWKTELVRMGGYLTNNGKLEMRRIAMILEGLAQREDDIFKRRHESEQRQAANNKRRKVDNNVSVSTGRSSGDNKSSRHPQNDFAANADALGLGGTQTGDLAAAQKALAGTNKDVVANIRAIRMANMSAAEFLKAELAGPRSTPSDNVNHTIAGDSASVSPSLPPKPPTPHSFETPSLPAKPVMTTDIPSASLDASPMSAGGNRAVEPLIEEDSEMQTADATSSTSTATKRKFEEGDEDTLDTVDDDEEITSPDLSMVVNADGTVEQADAVKLFEPGYQDRYYKYKFGADPKDVAFRKQVAKCYIEGMAWVLGYYYQGPPSWQWYYPYHFAPFAADFTDIDTLDIKFEEGIPFKPYEQLMGVFPAASRVHIPQAFHHLMLAKDSPIIDFYPEDFKIDMNGKRMAWQGVALLPFIDEKRLHAAMSDPYKTLNEDENRRNTFGNNVIFASSDHPIYPLYETLYAKRTDKKPLQLDPEQSRGISGSVLPNPECIPGSTYFSPLEKLDDIPNDCSLSVLYMFPRQLTPHRSALLPGVIPPPRYLDSQDLRTVRGGGNGGGRGRGGRDNYNQFHDRPTGSFFGGGSRGRGGGRGGHQHSGPPGSNGAQGRMGSAGAGGYRGGYTGGHGSGGHGGSGTNGGSGNGYGGGYGSSGGYYGGNSYGPPNGGGYHGGYNAPAGGGYGPPGGYAASGYASHAPAYPPAYSGSHQGRGGAYSASHPGGAQPRGGYSGYSQPPPSQPQNGYGYNNGRGGYGRGGGW